ncbi:hypothetical protein [Halobacillus litoralis]|nr:hypothetical protein [Halobacillus litoralis]
MEKEYGRAFPMQIERFEFLRSWKYLYSKCFSNGSCLKVEGGSRT